MAEVGGMAKHPSWQKSAEVTFMGRSSPELEACRHTPRSAAPRSRGYSAYDNQRVRNATWRNLIRRIFSSYSARCGPLPDPGKNNERRKEP